MTYNHVIADDHVCVADGLDLVNVVVLDDGVEQRVQVVQQLNYLTAQRRQANRTNTNNTRAHTHTSISAQ